MTIPHTVVFDIDDTLYLERDYVLSGFDAVGAWAAEHLGVPDFSARAQASFQAGVRGRIFDDVLTAAGTTFTEEHIAAMVACYRSHRPAITMLPDARQAVAALRPQVRLAVVTDGPELSQLGKAEALGLAEWAAPIVLTAQLGDGFGKPHPRAFEVVQAATGGRGPQCVYVSDNPAKDFAGPKRLGWRTVRVRRSGGLHHAADSGSGVDDELPDLYGLARLLGC